MLDLLYARAVGARRRWFERHPDARRRLHEPVISIGNLGVGGAGKTPLVARVAEWLIAQGERPSILSRGYKRRDRADGVVVVSDGQTVLADLDRAGDEPLMLARALPQAIVCVSDDRHLAGVLAERRLAATVHLLDDGFQHVQLARDFDVLVTAVGEIPHGRVLPFGRLREDRAAAARADFVVIVDADADTARAEAWELGISQFASARRALRVTAEGATGATGAARATGAGGATGAVGATGARAIAVAGIGRPEQFFSMLRDTEYEIAGTMAFADHHLYRPKDVSRIAALARDVGADEVLTTEKDAVRLEPHEPLPFRLCRVPMVLEIDGWERLTASIEGATGRHRERA